MSQGWDEYDARKAQITKDLAADFRMDRTRADLAKAAQPAPVQIENLDGKAWSDKVKEILADAVALGRDLDRKRFIQDPSVTRALEIAHQALSAEDSALPAFVAELLDMALRNAKESTHSLSNDRSTVYHRDAAQSLADPSWSVENQTKAAVIGALIKTINSRGYAYQGSTQQVQHGRSVARTAWKSIEPRVAFWGSPTFTLDTPVGEAIDVMKVRVDALRKSAKDTFGYSNPAGKFAGMTPAQIRKTATDSAARIDSDCSATLQKINGSVVCRAPAFCPGDRIEKVVGRVRSGVRANGNSFVEIF
jgi:hypothetical protein